jgi:uncharacterized sulfatase
MITLRRSLTVLVGCLLGAHAFAAALPKPNLIVIYTDDHGYADLGIQGVLTDLKTPHIDALARSGVLAKHGYSTAPQCVPSRAGLMVGKFQARFGVEANGGTLEGFDRETTFATRLQRAGYTTAQFGKWHLGPTSEITRHGFKHVFSQNAGQPFSANITLDGQDRQMGNLAAEMYHVDGCSRAAAASYAASGRGSIFRLPLGSLFPPPPPDRPPPRRGADSPLAAARTAGRPPGGDFGTFVAPSAGIRRLGHGERGVFATAAIACPQTSLPM